MPARHPIGPAVLGVALLVVAVTASGPALPPQSPAAALPRQSAQDWPTVRIRSWRTGPSRCPTLVIRTTAGPGDRSAPSTPRRRTASGSRSAASCRCPQGAKPWTPYAMLTPSRGIATGNDRRPRADLRAGREARMGAALSPRRSSSSIATARWFSEWPHHDKIFEMQPCGRGPHKIKMSPYDPEKHVWIIDDQLHMIYKFTYDGKLVHDARARSGMRGRDAGSTFDRPTDIAWLPDGTFFISDGYGGTRVAKFDKDGKFLMDWGSAAGGSRTTRARTSSTRSTASQISNDRRLFVVDRGHRRMQVFDENGKFLDMWPLRSPYWPADISTLVTNHIITQDQFIWAGDAGTNRILKFDLNGNFLYSWGAPGPQPGRLNCPHGLSTDQDGNFYVADCFGGRRPEIRAAAERGSGKAGGSDPAVRRQIDCESHPN